MANTPGQEASALKVTQKVASGEVVAHTRPAVRWAIGRGWLKRQDTFDLLVTDEGRKAIQRRRGEELSEAERQMIADG